MAGFFGRLDRLVDRLIETETLVPRPGKLKLVTLKPVFENLRYYTVLAFLWLGVRVLRDDEGWLASVGMVLLFGLFMVLGLLTALQTTIILLASAFGITSSLLAPRSAVKLRRRLRQSDRALKWLAYPLGLAVAGMAGAIGASLFSALARAGLL